MNMLVESGVLKKLECGMNFAFVLNNNFDFSSTEYKVLQSRVNGCFVRCMKMLFNGQTELYYLTYPCRSLGSILHQMDPERFVTIIGNLLAAIIDVKNNGFLVCNNIDSSMEHIFVDPNTLKVKLVYIPLNRHEYDDTAGFENAVRTSLLRIIAGNPMVSSPKTMQLSADLQNGLYSLEEIYSRLGSKTADSFSRSVSRSYMDNSRKPEPDLYTVGLDTAAKKGLKLVMMDTSNRFELVVDRPEFYIGKKETNDGILMFNKLISRVHCKITGRNGQYLIQDLESSNGTFVNGTRLLSGKPVLLKNGDVVRLANTAFRAVIS